jgi:hypothetical protein
LIFFDFQLLRRGLGGIAECIAFGEGIWWTSL